MPLQPPPANLAGFPARRASTPLRTLYRIYWHRDRTTGDVNGPWHFSCVGGTAGGPTAAGRRFDLPPPRGTCYWSDRRYGAWVEVFRGARLVASTDAAARRLWTGHAPPLRLANLLSKRAYLFGVTAAISSQPDYELPQQWAAALRAAGFDGLVGSCSHDPSSRALNVAVFGHAGSPRTRAGWTTRSGPLETDLVLLRELAAFGVRVAPTPYDVPTLPPPQPLR